MAPTATIPIDPAPWMEIITIGGPATAIIVVLGLMTIAVFRYAINPGLASYAKIAGEHRESAVEARVAATNSRDAAARNAVPTA